MGKTAVFERVLGDGGFSFIKILRDRRDERLSRCLIYFAERFFFAA